MKKFVCIMLLAFLAFELPSAAAAKKANRETVVFSVPMDCQGCVDKVEKNIAFEKGVIGLDVNLKEQRVAVTYDPQKTDPDKLRAAFKKIDKEARIVNDAHGAADHKPKPAGKK